MHRYLCALIAAMCVGLGLPQIEVALACRRPVSEACVWGHAYLPLNIAATLLLGGVPTFLVVAWFLCRRGTAK
jgi:putative exporter of polyketide antibiotics